MIEFRPSNNPKFPFEAVPQEWDRRIYLFTEAEREAFEGMSDRQKGDLIAKKKSAKEFRIRNSTMFQDKARS